MVSRFDQMKEIKEQVLALKESPLYEYRTSNGYLPVIGEGSHDSKVMFIGEAPGRNEAKTGRPFCGAAGKILDTLLAHIKLPREEVYITNIVKDRPPENRDPLPEEIRIYGPFLDRQINIIQPKIIGALGRYAMGYVMQKFGLHDVLLPISKMHGKSFLAKASYGDIVIVPLYHPAVAVYNSTTLDTLKEDFKMIRKMYDQYVTEVV